VVYTITITFPHVRAMLISQPVSIYGSGQGAIVSGLSRQTIARDLYVFDFLAPPRISDVERAV
jgi:hypothetical protein